MKKFHYIRGGAIKNAKGYDLLDGEKTIAHQDLTQYMTIYGGINYNGYPIETETETSKDTPTPLAPITKLTENGTIYYIRVTGEFDAETEDGATASVPFSGNITFDSAENVNIRYLNDVNDAPIRVERNEETGTTTFYFKALIQPTTGSYYTKEVEVFKVEDIEVRGASLVEGTVKYHSADKSVVRTSFIPISAVTDMGDGTCAGPFITYDGDPCPYDVIFYSGLSYGSKVAAYDHSQVNGSNGGFHTGGYLKFERLQEMAEQYPTAKYVIFCAIKRDENIVRVGNIYFPLFEMTDVLPAGKTYDLLVVAKADGKFFADSLPSTEDIKYTPSAIS